MAQKLRLFCRLFFLILVVGLLGCGGSKETVDYDPDPYLDEVIQAEPEPEIEQPEPQATAEDLPKRDPLVLQSINFDFDKSTLNPTARAILADNARRLQQYPEVNIRIEGHCDERGTVEYNLALGERRALVARAYLVSFGISTGRIDIISYGKERPVDPRHIPAAWDKNRRAEFVILN
ncbi:MAG: OmpA family protein [bacterium]